MCGIFGAKKFHTFDRLYSANKDRGTFSHGFMYLKKNGIMHLKRRKGITTLTGQYGWQYQLDYDLYLGHTQAPTSSVRHYRAKYSHPFEHGNFIVAHNGVLENHLELAEEHRIDPNIIKVDSQIIPMLLDDLFVGSDVLAIQEVCNLLKGIFSCWIYCKKTKLTYVVRSGCTLYTNDNLTTFSSIKFNKTKNELDQGIIYCFTPEGLTNVGTFASDNPFFVL
jgi:glucosamine 6-phosphate synthetase-like amidotransferase/phosphosugar isomerase protein